MRFGATWGRVLLLLLLISAGTTPTQASAQVPTTIEVSDTVWQIRLNDGSTIFGRVTATTGQEITVSTLSGLTIDLERTMIRSMSVARGTVRDGEMWPRDPNRTRLFFGPTGRMLDEGEGYIGVFELLLPFVSYSVSDYLTLAGGTPIIPEVIGRVYYFAPKVGARVGERTSLAGGVLAFHDATADDGDTSTVGVLYGVGTYGTDDSAATFGLGWGFAGDEVENRPVALLGLETRISGRVKVVSENYLITFREDVFGGGSRTQTIALLSGGLRIFGERLSADAGLGIGTGTEGTVCCVPLVNFVYNFGSR